MPIIASLLHGFSCVQYVSQRMRINQNQINAIFQAMSIRKDHNYEWVRKREEEKQGKMRRNVQLW